MKTYAELRQSAWDALSEKWGMSAVTTLVYLVIAIVLGMIPRYIATLLITLPITWGFTVLFLGVYRDGEEVKVEKLFDGFKDYGRILGTTLLSYVYIVLWTLLLIIPGIIKGYSYALTPFILKDHPELKFNGAIEESMRLMDGRKMRLFVLDLTFIGWGLLCIITCGIASLWVQPYRYTAHAAFYQEVLEEENAGNCYSAEKD